jgi:hypothetical protein
LRLPAIVLTAHGSIERAVQAVKLGRVRFHREAALDRAILLAASHALDRDRLVSENRGFEEATAPPARSWETPRRRACSGNRSRGRARRLPFFSWARTAQGKSSPHVRSIGQRAVDAKPLSSSTAQLAPEIAAARSGGADRAW